MIPPSILGSHEKIGISFRTTTEMDYWQVLENTEEKAGGRGQEVTLLSPQAKAKCLEKHRPVDQVEEMKPQKQTARSRCLFLFKKEVLMPSGITFEIKAARHDGDYLKLKDLKRVEEISRNLEKDQLWG
ncbi:MAG: hypothetical protein KME45_07560 [Stenomitos rutilans HA7619-LM2]|jgi:hypothetical protein|nr:hypothetical protein [Stenomitos rutilans HA7619-LM2]